MNIIDELRWRGLISDITDESKLLSILTKKFSVYCGVDPTADSLHIGHLLPIIVLRRFQIFGYTPIAVMGGATGMIGDPSGRSEERNLLSEDIINNNVVEISSQVKNILSFECENQAIIVNNYDWTIQLDVISFLRDYGKNFSINTMLAKDSVASRLETGLSFTEFSYSLLQSIDFLHLYEKYNCLLQIGGSDQWGNITAGLDLIRKKHGDVSCVGLTIPLITKSDGTKFGKTASGAVWLSPLKTTSYDFYQFFLNTADSDVISFLKYFTFLTKNEIDELEMDVKTNPHLRIAQKRLAYEVTKLVHGIDLANSAVKISDALFQTDLSNLTNQEISEGFKDVYTGEVFEDDLLVNVLVDNNIASSKREAKEFINGNAISINGKKITDVEAFFDVSNPVNGKYFLLKKGKKKYYLFEKRS